MSTRPGRPRSFLSLRPPLQFSLVQQRRAHRRRHRITFPACVTLFVVFLSQDLHAAGTRAATCSGGSARGGGGVYRRPVGRTEGDGGIPPAHARERRLMGIHVTVLTVTGLKGNPFLFPPVLSAHCHGDLVFASLTAWLPHSNRRMTHPCGNAYL